MIAFILIFFEGMFNSVMDCIVDEIAFNKSIFTRFKAEVWRKDLSSNAKRFPLTKFPMNPWHIAKFLMIFCFGSSLVGNFIWPEITFWPINVNWIYLSVNLIHELHWFLQIICFFMILGLYGLVRNYSFDLFFDFIFRKRADNRKI